METVLIVQTMKACVFRCADGSRRYDVPEAENGTDALRLPETERRTLRSRSS